MAILRISLLTALLLICSKDLLAFSCAGPDSLIAARIQADNIQFVWDKGDPVSYTIEFGNSGFMVGSGTKSSTTDTIIVIAALTENTVYDFYLISDCGGGMLDTIGPQRIQTLYYDDIGVSFLNAPQTACDLSDLEDITISISNYGQNPHQLFDFGYSLDYVEQEVNRPFDGFYTGVVGFDSTVFTTFDIKATVGTPGKYIFQVWTALADDSDMTNDTLTVEVFHQPVVTDYPYFWDFEEWEGGWVVHDSLSSNSSFQYGRPNSPEIPMAFSGSKSWVTNLIGNYNTNEKSVLISPCFDFSNMINDPYMSFALHYQGEACCDFALAEISINAGRNWTKIGDGENGINWYNDNDSNQWNGDGVAPGWSKVQNRLFGAAGRDSVRIRFVFESDHTNQGSGIGIDDIRIYEPFSIDLATAVVDHTSQLECGFDADQVLIAVENTGLNAVDQYIINYQLNGGPIVSQNIFGIEVDSRDTFIFDTPIATNMDGDYQIVAWVSAGGEANRQNDSLSVYFNINGVTPLPLIEDFEGTEFPTGWSTDNLNFGIDHNSPSSVFYSRQSTEDPSFELLAPNVGPISSTDTLIFDYRIVDVAGNGTVGTNLGTGDRVSVQISENCGISYENLFVINQANHIASANMETIKIDLSAYDGMDIKIKFVGQYSSGDYYVDIDNININGCPSELGLSIVQKNTSASGAIDGELSVTPTNGTGPYQYAWNNGGMTSNISGLGIGSFTVDVTDANGCMDMVSAMLESCPANLGLSLNTTQETNLGNDGTAMVTPSLGTGPFAYQWNTGVQTDMIFDLSMGSYIVTVTDSNGCSDQIEAVIDLQTSSPLIKDIAAFNIYPNPSNYQAFINIEFKSIKAIHLSVYNSVGQEVFTTSEQPSLQHNIIVDTMEYPGGIYFVSVWIDGELISRRFAVRH